jgi:hypothetical protein
MIVYKYPLNIIETQTILLPSNAIFLNIQTINSGNLIIPIEDNIVFLYALVDPNRESKLCEIQICGTGYNIVTDIGKYIDTFKMFNETLIFHAFISSKSVEDGFSVRT